MHASDLQASAGMDASAWGIHLAARHGAPPLRFSGRRLYHDCAGSPSNDLFVSLWQMRRRGFILEHSLPSQHPIGRTASRVDSFEEAIEALADFCGSLSAECNPSPANARQDLTTTLTTLIGEQQRLGRLRAFLNVAGLALAKWDGWATCADEVGANSQA